MVARDARAARRTWRDRWAAGELSADEVLNHQLVELGHSDLVLDIEAARPAMCLKMVDVTRPRPKIMGSMKSATSNSDVSATHKNLRFRTPEGSLMRAVVFDALDERGIEMHRLKLMPADDAAGPHTIDAGAEAAGGDEAVAGQGMGAAPVTFTVTRSVTAEATEISENLLDAGKVTGLPLQLNDEAEIVFWATVGRWLKQHSLGELAEVFATLKLAGYSVPDFRSLRPFAS